MAIYYQKCKLSKRTNRQISLALWALHTLLSCSHIYGAILHTRRGGCSQDGAPLNNRPPTSFNTGWQNPKNVKKLPLFFLSLSLFLYISLSGGQQLTEREEGAQIQVIL
jgi:hypothetical protein